MGSLMAGWNSPVLDPKSVKYKRNRSLTKEEIESYWNSKKKSEKEYLRALSLPPDQFLTQNVTGKDFKRSISFPPETNISTEKEVPEECKNIERKSIEKIGWWTRSNSAFLNEPPVLDGGLRAYASQYGVAKVDLSKWNQSNGIGA